MINKAVTYDSLRAEEAWNVVSQHLQRRNDMLTDGIAYLETHPTDNTLAGRLVVLQYHLRATTRRLIRDTASLQPPQNSAKQVQRQWMVVHQMHFLLSQIDNELLKLGRQSADFRLWRENRIMSRRVLKPKAAISFMN